MIARYARVWADSLKVGDVFQKEIQEYSNRKYTAWYEVTACRVGDADEAGEPLTIEVLAARVGGEYNAFMPDHIHEVLGANDIIMTNRGK